MTTTRAPESSAPASGRSLRQLVPGSPSVPQVNLLPPEIRASRSLAKIKQLLLLVLVVVIGVGVLGYFWSLTQVEAAENELAREEAESTRLLNAQKEFSEVPQVLGELDRATQARLLGTSTEILWAPFLTNLITTAPRGVAFEEVIFTGATPMFPATLSSNPLHRGEYVGTMTFTGRSLQVPDTAAWIESLETVPEFTDVFVSSMEITERDENGSLIAYYEVLGTIQVTTDALANRFVEEPEDAEGSADADDAEDEEAQG